MNIEFRFLSIADLKDYSFETEMDSENILQSGKDLYCAAVLDNPNSKDKNSNAVCLAIANGKIVGRFMIFQSELKTGDTVIPIQTGGGIFVSEDSRGLGIGSSLIRTVLNDRTYYGALYTRAAYDIIGKTETMLEIPQYVKYRYHGIKKILDLPIHLRKSILKRRYVVKRHAIVPEWAGAMASSDNHKYMEVHDTAWLQWALDNNATGVESDYQSFYAIYDRNDKPAGFFMTKVRTITKEGDSFVKANLIEWASTDLSRLDEADINILSLDTYPQEVSRFWTISENGKTAKKLKCHFYKRRGWFAMSITKDERFEDIGDVSQWRIRYGCCNTALVE